MTIGTKEADLLALTDGERESCKTMTLPYPPVTRRNLK